MAFQNSLITGASGEVGQALVKHLVNQGVEELLTIDIKASETEITGPVTQLVGDITDADLFSRLIAEYEFDRIYHLAALLSTRAEFTPETAHRVNVEGTMSLLKLAAKPRTTG